MCGYWEGLGIWQTPLAFSLSLSKTWPFLSCRLGNIILDAAAHHRKRDRSCAGDDFSELLLVNISICTPFSVMIWLIGGQEMQSFTLHFFSMVRLKVAVSLIWMCVVYWGVVSVNCLKHVCVCLETSLSAHQNIQKLKTSSVYIIIMYILKKMTIYYHLTISTVHVEACSWLFKRSDYGQLLMLKWSLEAPIIDEKQTTKPQKLNLK